VVDLNPDLIICTHFVPANLLTLWRKENKLSSKIWITLTDYEVHSLWVDKSADLYTVATSEMKTELSKLGIDQKIIHVTGIPIDLKFSQNFDKKDIRKKFGFEDKFTLSLFSGGFGIGPIAEILEKILEMKEDFQVLVSAGKNNQLYQKLSQIAGNSWKNIKIFKFIDNIEEIYVASDIMISKPGGLTVSETLATATPLLIYRPIPGQEEANSKYLLSNNAALRADTISEIINLVSQIKQKPDSLTKLQENIRKIAKPQAALEIAKLID
jgi:processive 1,2-diacylglycerol beta-glucosyltransferase